MFNLIVAVFSIALVAGIGIASYYYGEDIFHEQSEKTSYARTVNGAKQIEGAMELYKLKSGQYPAGIGVDDAAATEELLTRLMTENYLSGYPEGNWVINGPIIQKSLTEAEECEAMNRIAGFDTTLVVDGCPECSDPAYGLWPACVIN